MSKKLRFYLINSAPSTAWSSFVVLPVQVTYSGNPYLLMAGHFDDATHAAVIAAHADPAAWFGDVPGVRYLLRQLDLSPWWWLFDWFVAAHGVVDAADYR